MDNNTTLLIVALAFLLGILIGLFLPLVCVKLYNSVGCSLGDLCDKEDDGETDK